MNNFARISNNENTILENDAEISIDIDPQLINYYVCRHPQEKSQSLLSGLHSGQSCTCSHKSND